MARASSDHAGGSGYRRRGRSGWYSCCRTRICAAAHVVYIISLKTLVFGFASVPIAHQLPLGHRERDVLGPWYVLQDALGNLLIVISDNIVNECLTHLVIGISVYSSISVVVVHIVQVDIGRIDESVFQYQSFACCNLEG